MAAGCVLVASCGSGGGDSNEEVREPVPFANIDTEVWTADLVAAGGVRANPNLESLYDLTVDQCKGEQDSLQLQLTLSGARPDLIRINMTHVCPSQAHRVDDALESVQQLDAEMDAACETPEQLRTEEQQDMVDAVGCY